MVIIYKSANGAETTIIDETSNHIQITVGEKIEIVFDGGNKTPPIEPTALELFSSYKKQANSDRTETRRHSGLEYMTEDGEACESAYLVDARVNVERSVMDKLDRECLLNAVSKLKPDQQHILQAIFLSRDPISQTEYARRMGVSQAAVSQRLKTAQKNLKEILKTTL